MHLPEIINQATIIVKSFKIQKNVWIFFEVEA